jgi:hypothetical protein
MSLIIFISSILAGLSSLIYIISILKGKTKPQRITRFVIFVIVLLGTIALYANRDWPVFWLYVVYSVGNLFIFLFSIKHGMGGWVKIDMICLLISIIGIVVWQWTDEPLLGLLASILANIVGNIPAFLKTYEYPKTETWVYYFMGILSNGIILLAEKVFSVDKYIFPVYFIIGNTVFVILILREKLFKKESKLD